MIAKLSNQELDARLKSLVSSERKILHLILEHINEVDARRLYLEKSHASLYEYLVKECHYSGAAAMRRISAARLLKEVPSVSEEIQSGRLNLSQIGELTRAVKEKEKNGVHVSNLQKETLIAVIGGKTTAETQKEISVGLDLNLKIPEKKWVQKDDSVHLQITLSQNQYQKFLECKDLGASALLSQSADISLAAVIEHLTDHYLRAKTKTSSGKTKISGTPLQEVESAAESNLENPEQSDAISQVTSLNSTKSPNKTVTPKTRREILARDKCCQFKDKLSGKTCGSTFGLEVDHKKPQWAEGNHAIENLQALCRAHNNYKYQQQANTRWRSAR